MIPKICAQALQFLTSVRKVQKVLNHEWLMEINKLPSPVQPFKLCLPTLPFEGVLSAARNLHVNIGVSCVYAREALKLNFMEISSYYKFITLETWIENKASIKIVGIVINTTMQDPLTPLDTHPRIDYY